MTIPSWIVAASALVLTVLLVRGNHISVRVFAISTFWQFVIYFLFTVLPMPIETRQNIARVNIVAMNAALIIIILGARWKRG
jgi:multisubunit Na+/H+ antiporter MnhF subunit